MLCSFAYVNDSHAYVEAKCCSWSFLLLWECFGSTYLRSISAFGSFRTPSDEFKPPRSVQFQQQMFQPQRKHPVGGQIFRLRQTLPERRFYSGIKSSGHGFEVRRHKENETLFVDLCHRRFTARTVLLGLIACYGTRYFTCCPILTVVVARHTC